MQIRQQRLTQWLDDRHDAILAAFAVHDRQPGPAGLQVDVIPVETAHLRRPDPGPHECFQKSVVAAWDEPVAASERQLHEHSQLVRRKDLGQWLSELGDWVPLGPDSRRRARE